MVSNVDFKSNLYPLKKDFIYDQEFLSQIHDVFALEILKKYIDSKVFPHFKMSQLQREEYIRIAGHCIYAKDFDYPWGTIIDDSGKKHVVCKCLNVDCSIFKKCRPDFKSSELDVIEENEKAQKLIPSTNETIEIKITDYFSDEVKKYNKEYETNAESVDIEVIKKSAPSLELEVEAAVPPEANLFDDKNDSTETIINVEQRDFNSFVETTQEHIIKASPDERIIVNAGPGTGKTWTLIEKIIYMVNERGIDSENILVFCFSRAAVEVIRSRMAAVNQYEFQDVDIRTFDSFATYMISAVDEDYVLEDKSYDERIFKAISILKNDKTLFEHYENGHVIVDEVQDLVGARAEMVIELLKILPKTCGFTLLGDSCQALYDYLAVNDSGIMSSEKFYATLFATFPKANYYSLTENHRQTNHLESLTTLYREKILTGIEYERRSELNNVKSKILSIDVNFKELSQNDIEAFLKQGTLGILTRTNGQALQISSWLRKNDISHTLQRSARNSNFASWIAKIFYDYENLTIDEKSFIKRHLQIYPDIDKEIASNRWNAIVSSMNEIKKHYDVEKILRSIANNARDAILFENGDRRENLVTVSNIHRAKGKEFDSVILTDDVIDVKDEDILEHKVYYVGLTRAKKMIKSANIGKQYIYIIPNENRRCFKSVKFKKIFLHQFEVGIYGDIDLYSLGINTEVQHFIANDLKSDTSVKLIKCPENTRKYVTYKVVVEEPRYIILGYTDKIFAIEIERALKKIFNLPPHLDVFFSHYPNEFFDIYIDEIITCISSANIDVPAAKVFGNMKIWYGFFITGFAKIQNNRY